MILSGIRHNDINAEIIALFASHSAKGVVVLSFFRGVMGYVDKALTTHRRCLVIT